LSAQRGDPDVVGGDWFTGFSKFILHAGVKLRRRLRNLQDSALRQQTAQPRFVLFMVSRSGDPVSIFAERDHRNREEFGLAQPRLDAWIFIGECR
jgi:hypothetical protein